MLLLVDLPVQIWIYKTHQKAVKYDFSFDLLNLKILRIKIIAAIEGANVESKKSTSPIILPPIQAKLNNTIKNINDESNFTLFFIFLIFMDLFSLNQSLPRRNIKLTIKINY